MVNVFSFSRRLLKKKWSFSGVSEWCGG